MEAWQLFAQLRKELFGVAHDLYLYSLENKKTIEDEKIIEDKKHQIIKESYLKIMSLYGEFLKLEFLITEMEAVTPANANYFYKILRLLLSQKKICLSNKIFFGDVLK